APPLLAASRSSAWPSRAARRPRMCAGRSRVRSRWSSLGAGRQRRCSGGIPSSPRRRRRRYRSRRRPSRRRRGQRWCSCRRTTRTSPPARCRKPSSPTCPVARSSLTCGTRPVLSPRPAPISRSRSSAGPPEGRSDMATYLVTGAAGFIGQHLTAALTARGERVHAVDVELHEEAGAQVRRLREAGADYHRVDLTDPARVAELPDVDGVFHLAALNGTQNFYSSPWQTVKHSTLPTLLLLERYAGTGLEFFFYAGSSESYASVVSQFDWEIPTGEDVP